MCCLELAKEWNMGKLKEGDVVMVVDDCGYIGNALTKGNLGVVSYVKVGIAEVAGVQMSDTGDNWHYITNCLEKIGVL